jgi:hypothetical protein
MNESERRAANRSQNPRQVPHPLADGLVHVFVPDDAGESFIDIVGDNQFQQPIRENEAARIADSN